jgi:diamine N-acetyltransferase
MKTASEHIYLRAIEKEDATKIMIWENNPEFWHVSDTEEPYSMFDILQFIEQHEPFRKSGQLRLIICLKENNDPIGCIDLYEGNLKHRRAAVGILIADEKNRGSGLAKESIELLCDYASNFLDLHQLYAYIIEDNTQSIHLFEATGFEQSGILKQWRKHLKNWKNVLVYQKILAQPLIA